MMELDLISAAFSGLVLLLGGLKFPDSGWISCLERDWQKRLPVFPWGVRKDPSIVIPSIPLRPGAGWLVAHSLLLVVVSKCRFSLSAFLLITFRVKTNSIDDPIFQSFINICRKVG